MTKRSSIPEKGNLICATLGGCNDDLQDKSNNPFRLLQRLRQE